MDPIKANEKVKGKFKYKKDSKFGDPWKILDVSKSKIEGDCEDYSLTVLSLIVGGGLIGVLNALFTKKASILFCVDPQGENHHVLEYHKVGIVDNQEMKWLDKDDYIKLGYKFKYRQSFTVCLIRLLLGLIVK